MKTAWLIAAVVVGAGSGCAVAADTMYKLLGPHGSAAVPGSAFGAGRIDHQRAVAVDGVRGLVCSDVETPWVRRAQIHTTYEEPNGFKVMTQIFTAFEAGILGLVIGGREAFCAQHGCDQPHDYLLYLTPLLADVVWGTYRSFTIHDEIVRTSDVTFSPATDIARGNRQVARCPAGTELAVVAGPDQLIVHIGDDGFTRDDELAPLVAFIAAHPGFSIGHASVTLDRSQAHELVARMRARERNLAGASEPEPAGGSPPRVILIPSRACTDGPAGRICVERR